MNKYDVKSRLNFKCIRHPNVPIQHEESISRKEALEKGYKMYWNGTPCSNGHISVRYTSSGFCKKCYQLFRDEEITFPEISKDSLKRGRKKKEVKRNT
jgi:hypothetical protein